MLIVEYDFWSKFYTSFLYIFDMIYLYNINNNASGNTRYLSTVSTCTEVGRFKKFPQKI